MSNGFHCLKCGVDFRYGNGHCGEHGIPIATICNPPEPTTIDESDLAPGMVVVAVDDHPIPWHWLSSPDARIPLSWAVWAADKCVLRSAEHSMETIRRIAGSRRP